VKVVWEHGQVISQARVDGECVAWISWRHVDPLEVEKVGRQRWLDEKLGEYVNLQEERSKQ